MSCPERRRAPTELPPWWVVLAGLLAVMTITGGGMWVGIEIVERFHDS